MLLVRKTGLRSLAIGGFLVDAYCLGVKDAFFRELDDEDLDRFLNGARATAPLASVEPAYARKLLRDAAAYAQSLGLPPHADYAAVEPLFGDADAGACDVEFHFGHEGKPFYIPGPTESPTQIRQRLERLRRTLGDGGFDYIVPVDVADALDDSGDEDDEFEGAYDPAVAPDPAEWLLLDDEERIQRAEDFHRRCEPWSSTARIHAMIHAAVETQVALGDRMPVRRAMERLLAEGVHRHEAVHALGAVLTEHILEFADSADPKSFTVEAYYNAVERISAESWRRQCEEGEEARPETAPVQTCEAT